MTKATLDIDTMGPRKQLFYWTMRCRGILMRSSPVWKSRRSAKVDALRYATKLEWDVNN